MSMLSDSMKIYHISSNKEWGGGEQYIYDLTQRQLAEGWEVELFCRPAETVISKFRELNVAVHPLPLKGALDMRSAIAMGKIVGQGGPAVIHAHNFKDAFTAAYARKLSGRKDLRVVMCRHLTRTGKNGLLYRWLYRQLDCLCFDSQLSKEMFLSTNPTIDPHKLCIVHTSIVVPPTVEVAPLRQELSIPQQTVIAMFHGRLDPEKGLDTLMDAAALLKDKDFRLVLVGRGSEEYTAHLLQKIAANGLVDKVVLAGFRHPVLPYVAAADFGILASTVREGCPLSPQEYMSQGHPVVATNNGGQREYMVDGKNGLLVEPGDSKMLAEAMGRLIDDAPLRQKLGTQAKADFDDHLNYEHFFSQIRRLYETED